MTEETEVIRASTARNDTVEMQEDRGQSEPKDMKEQSNDKEQKTSQKQGKQDPKEKEKK